jgi:PAS domain S-box-containing protein
MPDSKSSGIGGGDPSRAPPDDATVPFRTLFESAPSLSLVLTPEDFTIVAVSEAYLRATMTERAAIMGRKLFEVFPDDPNEPTADGVRNLRKSLERVKERRHADVMAMQRYPVRRPAEEGGGFEERFWNPINSPVFGNSGQLTFIIHRMEDVTPFVRAKQREGKEEEGWHMLETRAQHIKAEIALRAYDRQRADELQHAHEQLRQSESRLQQMADAMPQIVWMARPDGLLDYYNSRWYEFTGFCKGADGDESWTRILHPDDVERRLERWNRSVRTGEPYEMRYRFLEQGSGTYRWYLGRALPVRDEQGQIVRWVGTCTDIDDLVRAEDSARRASEEAVRANRAKDEFLAALSHELRTPLTPVLLTASVLSEESRLPDDIREQLNMMQRNIELEARLIDDLLDLTRISRGKLEIVTEPVDVHSLLAHTEQIVRVEAREKSVDLRFALEARQHYVVGDGPRLHQVFWNVLKNAIKFTPVGGCITVRTANPAFGQFCLTVSDTGIGIDQETLPSIFCAFMQGHSEDAPRSSGLGLGMAISKTIVEMHGGAIRAESAGRGQGATFTIELATVSPFIKPAVSAPAIPARSDQRYRLLVVEDHEPTLNVLAGLLRRQGHDILAASTVETALALAATHQFDLVISDLGLPDGNGVDLMLQLTRDYGLRGIALSGYGMEEDLEKTKQVGFIAHLIKPIHFEQLSHVLKQAAPAVQLKACSTSVLSRLQRCAPFYEIGKG